MVNFVSDRKRWVLCAYCLSDEYANCYCEGRVGDPESIPYEPTDGDSLDTIYVNGDARQQRWGVVMLHNLVWLALDDQWNSAWWATAERSKPTVMTACTAKLAPNVSNQKNRASISPSRIMRQIGTIGLVNVNLSDRSLAGHKRFETLYIPAGRTLRPSFTTKCLNPALLAPSYVGQPHVSELLLTIIQAA